MSTIEGFVTTDDGDLAFLEHSVGDGPTLVFCHATGFCKEVWLPVLEELEALATGWTAVAVDQRHHGRSQGFEIDFDWWKLGSDLLAVIAGRGRVIGIGHSGGGAAIAMAEVTRPGSFESAILVEPIVFPPPYRLAGFHPLADGARRRRREFPDRAAAIGSYRGRGPFARWDERALNAYVSGGFEDIETGVALRCAPEAEAEFFLHASVHGMWDRLGELTLPVSLIAGEGSDTHPGEFLERQARQFGGPATTEIVRGATHFVPMEQPALIAERIAAVVNS